MKRDTFDFTSVSQSTSSASHDIWLEPAAYACATWNWLKPTNTLFADQEQIVWLEPAAYACATWNWLKPTNRLFVEAAR